MIQHLKRLGGDSLLYALMNLGTKLIAFLMLPIYTKYLSPYEMGAFEMVEALTSILTFIIIFGTDNALAYFFFKEVDEKEKERLFKSTLTFRLTIALLFLLIFIIFGSSISSLLMGTEKYKDLLYVAGIVLVLEAVITLVLTYYRFVFKSKIVASLTVFKLLLVAILSYLFLKFFNLNVLSIYESRLISGLIIIVLIYRQIWRFSSLKIEKDIIKKILWYGAPLVPASLAFWVITFSNRFFLSTFESLESSGIYGVAVKFATMISLLTSGVQMAWRPYSMSIKDDPKAKNIYANIFYIILVIGFIGILIIATIAPFLKILVADKSYYSALNYIALLSLGSFLSFYYLIISVGLFIKEKTSVISFYVIICSGISIVLNLLLIPLFSIWGAVFALIFSYLLVNVLIFIKSQSVYKIPVSSIKLIVVFIIGFVSVLSIVSIYFYKLNFYLIIFPWLVFLLVTWKVFDTKNIMALVRGRFN